MVFKSTFFENKIQPFVFNIPHKLFENMIHQYTYIASEINFTAGRKQLNETFSINLGFG